MSKWMITSKAAAYFGVYEGDTAEQAFAAMVEDGGSSDGAEGTSDDWHITRCAEVGDRVQAGRGEGHDTGRVERIDGDTAFVAWDSGVRTPIDLYELRAL